SLVKLAMAEDDLVIGRCTDPLAPAQQLCRRGLELALRMHGQVAPAMDDQAGDVAGILQEVIAHRPEVMLVPVAGNGAKCLLCLLGVGAAAWMFVQVTLKMLQARMEVQWVAGRVRSGSLDILLIEAAQERVTQFTSFSFIIAAGVVGKERFGLL